MNPQTWYEMADALTPTIAEYQAAIDTFVRNLAAVSAPQHTLIYRDGAWLLALPASYVAGLQVLVRSLVADRQPGLLSGPFQPQAFASAALMP